MHKTSYNLYDFLSSCGGSWRNAIFIRCAPCRRPCENDGQGCLLTADRSGRPRVTTVSRFERTTGQRIDPSECLGTITREAFEAAFRQHLVWELEHTHFCSLHQLDARFDSPAVSPNDKPDKGDDPT